MKAVILAGGLGTRLKPLTDKIPKVMVDIGGKPLLYYHLNLLRRHGITDIWINLHYLPGVIMDYFGSGAQFGVDLKYSFEKELLGTAGALKNPDTDIGQAIVNGEFLVIYGDNLVNINYTKLIDFHRRNKSFLTIALYTHPEPWTKGVVELGADHKITAFIEKPPKESNPSNLVNSGIYICNPKVLDYINPGVSDFGFDVFPNLIKEKLPMFGFSEDYYIQDIGTPEALEKARGEYRKFFKDE